MTSIVDRFVIELGLDTREYRKGSKEAEDALQSFGDRNRKRTAEVEVGAKAMARGFSQARNELLSLVAVAFGAKSVKDFFSNMVAGQSALGRVARNLGETAREIDAWGAAVESVGGTASGFQSSMQAMQAGFEAFKLGENSPVVQAFHALGVNIADAEGKVRPMREMLLDLSGALTRLAPQDQIRAAQMLGIDEGTLNLLRQGRTDVAALVEKMYAASGVTQESTERAAKAQAQWAQLKRELYGVGQAIFEALVPALNESNDSLSEFGTWTNEHKGEIADFFREITALATAAGKAVFEFFLKPTELDNKLNAWISDSKFGRWLGETTAKVLAYGGHKGAAEALAINGASGGGTKASTSASGAGLFETLEKKFGIPAGTLDRMWSIESGRGKNMVSSAGATGHFQFMPATAQQFGLSRGDTFDLDKSATAAAQYIAQLLKKYGGDMKLALSAYNWGPGNLDGKGIGAAPAETVNYWKRFQQAGGPSNRSNTTSVQTNIQNLTVNTKATDAAGVARDLNVEMERQATMTFGTLAAW